MSTLDGVLLWKQFKMFVVLGKENGKSNNTVFDSMEILS